MPTKPGRRPRRSPRIRALEPLWHHRGRAAGAACRGRRLAEVRRQVRDADHARRIAVRLIDAERAIEQWTCDLFNLRLSKCGGFIPSLAAGAARPAARARLSARLPDRRDGPPLRGRPAFRLRASPTCATSKAPTIATWCARHWATHDLTFGWGGWAPALDGPGSRR